MKYTEDVIINNNIKISKKDKERYIGKEFRANCGLMAKCIGIFDILQYNSTKRYVVEFEDGRRTIAEGGKLRSGSFTPLPFTPQKKETKQQVEIKNEDDSMKYTMQLEKKVQRLMDQNRILRKQKREFTRRENIDTDFFDDVALEIKKRSFVDDTKYNITIDNPECIIAQLSDLHFGKFIDTRGNKFNFDIADDRLMQYAEQLIDIGNKNKVNKLILAFTGDLFVLDSHLDCLLSNEDNRAVNFMNGVDILRKFINKLIPHFNISMLGVLGNESRVKSDAYQSNIDKIASNSFDMMVFQVLGRLFENNIKILNDCNTLNDVMDIYGHKIAFTHGDKYKAHDIKSVVQFKSVLMEEYKTNVDYVIFGHIHSSMITPNFSRSGSLCGSDEYAKNGLHISGGVSSQNIYFVGKNIIGMEIRLD